MSRNPGGFPPGRNAEIQGMQIINFEDFILEIAKHIMCTPCTGKRSGKDKE